MQIQPKERIIVALDVPSRAQALALVRDLMGHVGLFKVGLELVFSEGPGMLRQIADLGAGVVFDGKFHDIPNTVAAAARAATRSGASMFTVHVMGGREMLRASVDAARDEAARLGVTPPLVLGVTVLTSLDESALADELGVSRKLEDQVVHLARLALDEGVDGLVASPREVTAIRALSKRALVLTPGVRPAWSLVHDQRRVQTPAEAVLNGASYLVIGRPILDPPTNIGSPAEAADRIAGEIRDALTNPTRRS
jgi:orotidine-5'-phosphate decarboxylase